MRGVERPLNDDSGSLVDARTANFDGATIKFHNHFDQGQAQPHAWNVPRVRFVGAIKAFK